MCRQYCTGSAVAYVRLCYVTGHQGEHWSLTDVLAADPGWAGAGHVAVRRSPPHRRAEAPQPERPGYARRYGQWWSCLPCKVCGQPTPDEVCPVCAPTYDPLGLKERPLP